MGMFDYVSLPETMKCVQCAATVSEFQTKDGITLTERGRK